MKKMVIAMIIMGFSICGLAGIDAHAETIVDDTIIINVAKDAATEAYEDSVISRTAGRAGAGTEVGAKGIIFENIYADKKNIQNFVEGNGCTTQMTKSSIAQQVDLVTLDANGKVVERFQLKDTPNSIDYTIKQVESGKYTQAQLIGTTETCESYAEKAASKGITKVMQDSKISTKTTEKIAEKMFSESSTLSKGLGKVKNGGVAGGIISGTIETAKAVYNDEPLDEAIGSISTEATKGAIIGGTAEGLATVATIAMTSAGAGAFATVAVPTTIAVGTGIAVGYGLDYVDERYDVKGKVTDTARIAIEKENEGMEYLANAFVESGYDEKTEAYYNNAKEKTVNAGKAVVNWGSDVVGKASKMINR